MEWHDNRPFDTDNVLDYFSGSINSSDTSTNGFAFK
jgi:hypothetical protein